MRSLIFFLLALVFTGASAQRFRSEQSHIKFFSDAPMEDITAINEEASSIVDLDSREMVFVVPIKSFQFEKKLMQEHFNENYLESEKYPKAFFKGKISEWNGENGENPATATGELEIHGIKQDVTIEGTIIRSDDDTMTISAVFPVKLEDYKIKIPKVVFYKIAEEVEVTIKIDYKAL